MQRVEDENFEYFEFEYRVWSYRILTTHWPQAQGGMYLEAMARWFEIFLILELDRTTEVNVLLLSHLGATGRALGTRSCGTS